MLAVNPRLGPTKLIEGLMTSATPHQAGMKLLHLPQLSNGRAVTDRTRWRPFGIGSEAVDAHRRQAPHMPRMTDLTVWYDGHCPLCRAEIALMRRLDTRRVIRFVDAITSGADACPLDRRALLARFHASEDGKLLSGAAAFAAMWRAIPLLRPIGLLARSPAVLGVLEAAYLGFLRVRPALQRVVRRIVPS